MMDHQEIRGKVRAAGLLIIIGLIVESLCLLWSRPIAFVVLVALGGLLILAGVATFLLSLVSSASASVR
jgi:hypothetical protein